jgi:hypothetical protein
MPGELKFTYTLPDGLKQLADRFPKAANAVLNRTGTETRTKMAEYVAQVYNVDESKIKKRITVRQSTWTSLTFRILVQGRKFPVIDFLVGGKVITAQKGVRPINQKAPIVEILRGKKTALLESPFPGQQKGGKAFVMKSKTQGFQIRRRSGEFMENGKEHSTLWRYIRPIIFFKNPKVWSNTTKYVEERLLKELPRVIKVFIETGRES